MAGVKELLSFEVATGGQQQLFSHTSLVCKCVMKFAIYTPPAVLKGTVSKVPVLYFLHGMGSNIENEVKGTDHLKYAAEHSLVVVSPDSSPRYTDLPGEVDHDMLYGHGAGWYLDATTPGWKEHYNMFSYVSKELISVIEKSFNFVLPGRRGITGVSMGAYGALLTCLARPDLYQSVSATFAGGNESTNYTDPASIAVLEQWFALPPGVPKRMNPLELYLGPDPEAWKRWDVYEQIKAYNGPPLHILFFFAACDQLWDFLKCFMVVKGARGKENISMAIKLRAGLTHGDAGVVMGPTFKYHAQRLHRAT